LLLIVVVESEPPLAFHWPVTFRDFIAAIPGIETPHKVVCVGEGQNDTNFRLLLGQS